jgi:dipeptidyl aminopeptidase/acylaminoacyl peptidase
MFRHSTLLLLLVCLSAQLFAQDKSQKWTPDDIIHTEYLRSATFSPDGQMVAWTKRRALKEKDKFISDIYLTRLSLKKDQKYHTTRMTSSDENDYAPLFSKDSESLYFLSSREKGKKLWRMSIYGGEAEEVHTFEEGISNIQWITDSTFAYVSSEGKSLYQQQLKEKKDNVVVVEDSVHWTVRRLYQFDVKKKKAKRLTSNEYPLSSYTLSRDGQWAVYRLTMSPHFASDAQPDPRFYLKNLSTGEEREILEGLQTPRNFQFTTNHKGFYFTAIRSSDPEWNGAGVSLIYYYDLSKYEYEQVPLDWKWESEGSYWVVGNSIVAELPNGPLNKLAYYQKLKSGWKKSAIRMGDYDEHTFINTFSKDGTQVVFEHSTAGQLPKYYHAKVIIEGQELKIVEEETLVQLNKKLQKKPITKYEILRWKGYNDEEVNGILYYPENYVEGKKYPLMLSIHGGPSGVDRDSWRERWSTYPQILSQRGAFVLKPNYHGSSHHGQAFVESIKGNYYDLELEDILKGIDVLADQGKVDKQQMGVMGWSNGAILATMLTVRYPDMFKVACPGAGDVNWTSDYGTCRFGVSFDQSYFGGAPWDDVDGKTYNERYITLSPLFELEKVKTPTIIFHGSEDRAVPRDQGFEYYRALQQSGKAPVRFLWFPGQPHGLQKITHQMRKMEEELEWIDAFLFEKEAEPLAAYKKDSPLAQLMEKDSAAMENGLLGVLSDGKLLPEVVAIGEDTISIARFELTNAQYAASASRYRYPKGQENYPAVLSFAQAKTYIQWLNKTTGKRYRLPTVAEAKSFHEKAEGIAAKENTLNYWAGYEITIDEVPALKAKIERQQLNLIKEVGQFPATTLGKAKVYDLGGNLAEYAEDGSTYGYHAYQYVDKAAETEQQTRHYIGIRVVLD